MKKLFLFFITFFILAGCAAPRENFLKKIAEEGNIHTEAPLADIVTITIDAPVSKVWDIITNIPEWPKWEFGYKGHIVKWSYISG